VYFFLCCFTSGIVVKKVGGAEVAISDRGLYGYSTFCPYIPPNGELLAPNFSIFWTKIFQQEENFRTD